MACTNNQGPLPPFKGPDAGKPIDAPPRVPDARPDAPVPLTCTSSNPLFEASGSGCTETLTLAVACGSHPAPGAGTLVTLTDGSGSGSNRMGLTQTVACGNNILMFAIADCSDTWLVTLLTGSDSTASCTL